MTQLTWNDIGARIFEVGVDRGVLYLTDGTGVAWNGLIAVKESPSGGESSAYYIDGVKYLNVASRKEFNGVIEAFTYPDEFAEYDGWTFLENGLAIDEQHRKSFGLSYRTRVGNDIDGYDHGYKIHIVYNALATPSDSTYSSVTDDADPLNFSWSFTTTPVRAISNNANYAPMSHVVVDSTKTNPTQLQFIEDYLYGSLGRNPRIPSLAQVFSWFEHPAVTLIIQDNPVTGLSPLLESETTNGDIMGRLNEGLYTIADNSRLTQYAPGLYILEP